MGLAKGYLSISERDRIARELLSDAKPAAENRRFTSACPFHSETTPGGAFWYDPEKDQAVCYSCGNFGDLEYRDYLITTPGGLKIMFWGSNATPEQLGIIRELKPDIAIMQFTKQTPEDLAAMAEAGSVKVLIPHHMDLAMSEDVYLPRIEEMERAVHARVPGCTVITPERLRWYHMGLSVWA